MKTSSTFKACLSAPLFKLALGASALMSPLLCDLVVSAAQAAPMTPSASRAPVTDFELKDLKGRMVRLSQHKGKVVLVNFWATWCAPCKQELPHLNRLYKELKDEGFEVLAISTDSPQTIAQVGRLARRWAVTTLLDPEGRVVSQLNPRGVAPYTLIVDAQGRAAFEHDGYHSGDEVKMEEVVRALLAEMRAPKAEAPKAEEPKAEEPATNEEPKAEEPKAEEPKAEEPKAEEPKAEEPKAEEPAKSEPSAP